VFDRLACGCFDMLVFGMWACCMCVFGMWVFDISVSGLWVFDIQVFTLLMFDRLFVLYVSVCYASI